MMEEPTEERKEQAERYSKEFILNSLDDAGLVRWKPLPETLNKEVREAKAIMELMYHEIIDVLKSYLVMPEEYYKFIAIWIIGTYSHEYFGAYPYLFFNAMRGSGKTRALKLISTLGAGGDGSVQNNLTEAVLFRIPRGKTTCIDEVEQIGSKDKTTLRELLNAAYKKGMKVCRMKKTKKKNEMGILEETHETEEFEPYFPIAMANINGMDEVVGDRSITLVLEKSDNPAQTKKSEDFINNIKIRWIKDTLMQFGVVVQFMCQKKHIEKWNFYVTSKYNYTNNTNNTNNTNYTNYTNINIPAIQKYIENTKMEEFKFTEEELHFFNIIDEAGITGRNFELFLPIFIMAQFIGEDVFKEIFEISKGLVKEKKAEENHESNDVSLFHFVLSKEEADGTFLSVKELTREFSGYIGEEINRDSWLNDKWFGRALKRLNLVVDKRRMKYGVEVKLNYFKAREKLKIFL